MKEKNRKRSQTRLVTSDGELKLVAPAVGTAPCVPAIKTAVNLWVKSGYTTPEGSTETSKTLLNYWFHSDHRLANGRAFMYNTAQREAMETLVYVYEVAKIRRQRTMLEQYAVESKHLELLQHDDFARYCFKMATGSGKTKVMALAVAWQYFNAIMENIPGYSKTALFYHAKKANGKVDEWKNWLVQDVGLDKEAADIALSFRKQMRFYSSKPSATELMKSMRSFLDQWKQILKKKVRNSAPVLIGRATSVYSLPTKSALFVNNAWHRWE